MESPPFRQVRTQSLGKAGVIEHDSGSVSLLFQLKPGDGVHSRLPVGHAPGLDDSLGRHQIDLPSDNVSAENYECASHLTAYSSRLRAQGHGLLRAADFDHLVELAGIGKRLVNPFPAGLESILLVNGLRRMGD